MAVFDATSAVFLALLASTTLAPAADAHGWIENPLARQFCNGNTLKWQVSISGGNGARQLDPPYGGVPGLCGDPFEGSASNPASNFEARPCVPQQTYQEGSSITTQIDVAANHGGFWEVSICDSKEISQECFDRNKLRTVEFDSEQWWIQTRTLDDPTDKRPDSYFMDWQLPPGLVCDHCVMQWTWWTAHNCVFECDARVCGEYANRRNTVVRPDATWKIKLCPTKFPAVGQQPQIFRNCADIRIEGSGVTTNPGSLFTEQPTTTFSRRSMLNNGVLEEDSVSDISGAGNSMNCENDIVQQVLVEINKMRKEVDAQPLECSNRAVGVSQNFSEIMADLGTELDDSTDNCKLAGFKGRCVQMVATGGTSAPPTTLTGIDHVVLVAPEYAVAGVGYYDVDGVTYWTLLMG